MLLFVFVLPASSAEALVKDRVCEEIVPNGLKVILLESHKAPLVTFQVWSVTLVICSAESPHAE